MTTLEDVATARLRYRRALRRSQRAFEGFLSGGRQSDLEWRQACVAVDQAQAALGTAHAAWKNGR